MATATLENPPTVPAAHVPASKMNVYQCIAAVSGELAKDGIGKDRSNIQQNYKFRGIDDVMNALAPILAENKLVILPRCLSRDVVERQTQKGGTLFYVTVDAEFDFVSAADSSKHTVKMYGEAMDSADKATNKAMSAAYKYAAIQTFCIPTEGDNDADATTHELAAKAPAPKEVLTAAGQARWKETEIGHLGTMIARVEETTIPSGKMQGRLKWYVHFENGEKGQTISSTLAAKAQQLYDAGTRVQAELKKTQWGYDLMALFPVTAPSAPALPEIQLRGDEHGQPVSEDEIPF